jgi:hypothetical protein
VVTRDAAVDRRAIMPTDPRTAHELIPRTFCGQS